jgi:hypothetical protein
MFALWSNAYTPSTVRSKALSRPMSRTDYVPFKPVLQGFHVRINFQNGWFCFIMQSQKLRPKSKSIALEICDGAQQEKQLDWVRIGQTQKRNDRDNALPPQPPFADVRGETARAAGRSTARTRRDLHYMACLAPQWHRCAGCQGRRCRLCPAPYRRDLWTAAPKIVLKCPPPIEFRSER